MTSRADPPPDPAPPIKRNPRPRFGLAARVAGSVFAVAIVVAAILGFLVVTRYLPALDDARALRA